MKRLSSFMIMNIDGGDRVSYTYNEIDGETGKPISMNNKDGFFVVNQELQDHIEAMRDYIRRNELEG